METRRRTNKRQIDFSSSEDNEEVEAPQPVTYKVKRVILKQPGASAATQAPAPAAKSTPVTDPVEDADGNETSDLSEVESLEEEEAELDEDMLMEDEPDLQGASDYDDPDEDEEAILRTMMKPMIDKSKKTKRQKARDAALDGAASTELWSLPTERQSLKPVLTAEEAALRKVENKRKRKNQTEKKLEEEKRETINRLLNKQASKARGAASKNTVSEALDEEDEAAPTVRATRPLPRGMIRYISNKEGATVSLPTEVVGHPMTATLFGSTGISVVGQASA